MPCILLARIRSCPIRFDPYSKMPGCRGFSDAAGNYSHRNIPICRHFPSGRFFLPKGRYLFHTNGASIVRKAIEPLGEARPDWQIVTGLATLMLTQGDRTPVDGTHTGWDYHAPADIMTEINALTPSYAGSRTPGWNAGNACSGRCRTSSTRARRSCHTKRFANGAGRFTALEGSPASRGPG